MILRLVVCFVFFICTANNVQAQARHYIFISGGVMNYVGDLKEDIFPTLDDINPQGTIGYEIGHKQIVRGGISYTYGMVNAADSLNKNPTGNNLSFKSDLHMLNLDIEFNFIGILPNANGRVRHNKRQPIEIYLEAGVGVLYHNPKTYYNGRWVNLRPLGTEGQFTNNQSETYSQFNMIIKGGIGFIINIGLGWGINFYANYHYLTTDYLDDVGGRYPDYLVLQNGPNGQTASELSYRGSGNFPDKGSPRAKDGNDGFLTFGIGIEYNFVSPGRKNTWKPSMFH